MQILNKRKYGKYEKSLKFVKEKQNQVPSWLEPVSLRGIQEQEASLPLRHLSFVVLKVEIG